MLKNLFSFNKSQVVLFTTMAVIIFLGLGYLFIYIPNNEKKIQAQYFRTLQNADKNLHSKIENSVTILNNLLSEYERNPDFDRYLLLNNSNNFTLIPPESSNKKNWNLNEPIIDSSFSISTDNNSKQIILLLSKKQRNATDSSSMQIGMKFSFEQFIKYIFPENIFDEYLIFSENKTVYETFPSGITTVDKDSLMNIKNGLGSSGIINRRISAVDYKLFLQPIVLAYNSEWIIAGLLNNNRYQAEKNQIPTTLVLTLVTVLLIILISFPWIKLFQMGGKDRLTLYDGILSLLISMLLMSLLFFSFFKYNLPFRDGITADSKGNLLNAVTKAFNNDLNTAYQKISTIDSIAALDSNLFTNDLLQITDSSTIGFDKNKFTINPSHKSAISSITKGYYFTRFFWLDDAGWELSNWNKDKLVAPHSRYDNRAYFKNIQTGNYRHLQNDSNKKYYLDQVISYNSGVFTSVISIPSRATYKGKPVVAAISINIKSLDSVVMPTGYQFAIIDSKGKVIYHYLKSKNLNENLLQEFSEKETLISHMVSKTKGSFLTAYSGKKYNALIKPINGMPYFILILSDTIFKDTRDMEIYSFTLSMMLIFFGILIIQLLTVFLVSSRRSFLKNQLFDSSWIGPRISCNKEYIQSVFFNIILIVMLILCFKYCSLLHYFFSLLYCITAMPLYLNLLFAVRYKAEKRSVTKYKINSCRYLSAIILLLNLLAIKILLNYHYIYFAAFQLISLLLGFAIFYFKQSWMYALLLLKNKLPFLRFWNHINSFALMGLTRLIITSGIPIVFFYYVSYNYEQQLSSRYKQLEYHEKLSRKLPATKLEKLNSNKNYPAGIYFDSAWITKIEVVDKKSINITPTTIENQLAIDLLKSFRINFSDIAIKEDQLFNIAAADSSIIFNDMFDGSHYHSGRVTSYRKIFNSNQYIKLQSENLNYKFPVLLSSNQSFTYKGLVFWSMLLTALVLYYFILLIVIKKIFALSLPDLQVWKELDNRIICDEKLNSLVFIIGLPGAGKRPFIKNLINEQRFKMGDQIKLIFDEEEDSANNVLMADMINIPDSTDTDIETTWDDYLKKVFNPKYKLIIVNHFEYNIQDPLSNRKKLNLLEKLMLDNQCKIVILSSIHPVAFLDSISFQTSKPEDKSVPGQDLERWHVLLGHYRILLLPLESGTTTEITKPTIFWQQRIKAETQYTHFLNKMQQAAIEVTSNLPEEGRISRSDELAFKLQVTAHYFYMYIWQSLTKEEKFLLFDLAEDNLINTYDAYNLSMLIGKGLIINKDGSLKLFNKGFRNFILTAIGNTEAMKLKMQIADNGNWSKLKNPMLLVTLAILAFLLTSQEESYSKIITYFAALAAGVPTILKIFSIFEKPGEKN